MRNQTINRLQAEATFEQEHARAQDLVKRIHGLLFDMPAPGTEGLPINWAHVGSIKEVNTRLANVVAFLTNSER